jgi:branched-chain amino acid transport system substrate-binding protein
MILTNGFYWDYGQRFQAVHRKMLTMMQAAVYSAVLSYLKAIEAAGTDGKMVHDMLLAQVKTPAESKGEWDLYKVLETIPGDKAFAPLADSKCPLVRR